MRDAPPLDVEALYLFTATGALAHRPAMPGQPFTPTFETWCGSRVMGLFWKLADGKSFWAKKCEKCYPRKR